MDIFWLGNSSFRLKGKGANVLVNPEGVTVEERLFSGPGEYESKGVMIGGVNIGGSLAYWIGIDGLNIVYLSTSQEIDKQKLEEMDEADILLTPLASIVADFEPKIIIPFSDDLDKLLKELGVENPAPQPKLSITKDKLPEEPLVVSLDHAK